MRTFKGHLIDGSNLQETLINSEFKFGNYIIREFVTKLNQTPNKKTVPREYVIEY